WVLGPGGGVLGRLLRPVEFCLGGRIGHGRQWMSWIERDDLVRLIAHIIATPSLTGAVNATAPEPVTNATFTRALARALGRSALVPMPAMLLHRLAGDLADELLIGGHSRSARKADPSGFIFRHPPPTSPHASLLAARHARPARPPDAPSGTPSGAAIFR